MDVWPIRTETCHAGPSWSAGVLYMVFWSDADKEGNMRRMRGGDAHRLGNRILCPDIWG